jgi:hypothetical protein
MFYDFDAAAFGHAPLAVSATGNEILPGGRLELLAVDRDRHLLRIRPDASAVASPPLRSERGDQA